MRILRDYQKLMLRYEIETQHPFLAAQMRLGKTIVKIRSARVKGFKTVLVVAPYSALYSWDDELRLENENKVTKLFGARKERLLKLDDDSKWFLINKEGHQTIPEIADIKWDSVIIDESHILKGPQSQISKFFIENFRDVSCRSCLTGTPAPENELDYFNQLRFLDHKYWKEKNYYQFRHKNFGIYNHTAYISPEGSRYIMRNLARRVYFLSRDDVRLGGKKVYMKRLVEMSPKVRKIYNKAEKEFVLEYLNNTMETIYATTKYIWLRRLCGGFADKEFISYAKLKELKYLMDTELKNEPLVILCRYVNETEKVSKFLKKWWKIGTIHGDIDKEKERPRIIKEFQIDKITDHIVSTSGAIKNGTNLSRSNTIVFYSSTSSGETRQQVEDRIVNTATNDSNLILDLVCKDTVEEKDLVSVKRKDSKQKSMKYLVTQLQKKYGLMKYSKESLVNE